jgi:hypothetical protein
LDQKKSGLQWFLGFSGLMHLISGDVQPGLIFILFGRMPLMAIRQEDEVCFSVWFGEADAVRRRSKATGNRPFLKK